MSAISTHVLDTSLGKPAGGVPVSLAARQPDGSWKSIAAGVTDGDGRWRLPATSESAVTPGVYKLAFDTAAYFRARNAEAFFPLVEISFSLRDAAQNHHVPLLLSPYSYSAYRGS
jgi:5-hydroxyisourate hydrolase